MYEEFLRKVSILGEMICLHQHLFTLHFTPVWCYYEDMLKVNVIISLMTIFLHIICVFCRVS